MAQPTKQATKRESAGMGIPEKVISSIFDLFFTVQLSGKGMELRPST